MITLVTGTPGAGKTLLTLYDLKNEVEKQNAELIKQNKEPRPVYYHGIPDLTLPWLPLDKPENWHTLPTGAIIVIDECQSAFRPRGLGQQVPEYIAAMETHRHRGHDLYLITQHPMLVDQNIRRLVGRHRHVIRKFGLQVATVHEWGSVHEITKRNLAEAVKRNMKYPKEIFGYYKSSEQHTHKANVPKRVYFLAAAPLIVGALVYAAYTSMTGISENVASKTEEVASAPSPFKPSGNIESRGPVGALTTADYLARQVPRVQGMPWTAPIYDDVTTPVDAPYPVACMDSKKNGCRCFDQQENRIAVDEGFCKSFLDRGMFVAWKQKPQPQQLAMNQERQSGSDRSERGNSLAN